MSADAALKRSELRLACPATLDRPRAIRHALESFLTALGTSEERRDDIMTAIGEALANAVEHAYAPGEIGRVELRAHFDEEAYLVVEVADDGTFIERDARPNRGFGIRIISAIASRVAIERASGTRVTMHFDVSG